MNWNDKTILVTGGTGSFGRKFVATMLEQFKPKKVIIFSRDELKQHEMRTSGFDHPSLRYFIGDVRDAERLRRAMNGVDIVVHAAALKQVVACEYNPLEAVKTNIDGAKNIIDAAIDAKVQKVLALSTDKAVSPVNLYGATKLVAEKLFVQANAYTGGDTPKFACVRYGNVVGSRGSVVPVFLEQRKTGRVTVTDKRMTRFWITLEQGVKLVTDGIEQMHGGEIFVPKITSMNIMDLVRIVAPDCKVDEVGIRPGEKLHEALLSDEEATHTLDAGDKYVVMPVQASWSNNAWTKAKPVDVEFRYVSNLEGNWMTDEELRSMVRSYETP
jgi:UDP-N-acetylglucosamine 4,6-dehydratase